MWGTPLPPYTLNGLLGIGVFPEGQKILVDSERPDV